MYKSDFVITALGFSLAAVAALEHWEDGELLPFQKPKSQQKKSHSEYKDRSKSSCLSQAPSSKSRRQSPSPSQPINDLVNTPTPQDINRIRSESSASSMRSRDDSPGSYRSRTSSRNNDRRHFRNESRRDFTSRDGDRRASSRGDSSESDDVTSRRWNKRERSSGTSRRDDDAWKDGRGVFRCGDY